MKIDPTCDLQKEFLISGTKLGLTRRDLAKALSSIGVTSKSGLKLTESHISNFGKEVNAARAIKKYEKPTYKGRNHITG